MARLSEDDEGVSVGIIGMGDMGRMYARRLSDAGWKVNACDREERFESLKQEYAGTNINILKDGHFVSRDSDFILYSVEAESIGQVVSRFGLSTKVGAIVGGQTSCKAPEIAAFEKYLPLDVQIVSCHSLHGPSVDPRGQPLVIVPHRASDKGEALVRRILSCFHSNMVTLSAADHDRITADTQAVTHAAFLSMGSAWYANNQFPWQVSSRYMGGIENVKINLVMRIFSNKWHVYAGLAILNPSAQQQIRQYATSVTELFKLMLAQDEAALRERIQKAGDFVFSGEHAHKELLLQDDVLDRFSLAKVPREDRTPNNHLSLLAMVDSWWRLGIVPYDHMICSTPLFRVWLGVTEYLFKQPALLNESINMAIHDLTFRSDDLEFTFAARAWSECVSFGDFQAYRKKFEGPKTYFAPRFPEATRIGNEMLKTIFERTAR